jgi:hypothetical protein
MLPRFSGREALAIQCWEKGRELRAAGQREEGIEQMRAAFSLFEGLIADGAYGEPSVVRRGEVIDARDVEACHDCGRPLRYDEKRGVYVHLVLREVACFLHAGIDADEPLPPRTWGDSTTVSLDGATDLVLGHSDLKAQAAWLEEQDCDEAEGLFNLLGALRDHLVDVRELEQSAVFNLTPER